MGKKTAPVKAKDSLMKILDTSLNGIMVFSSIRDQTGKIVDLRWEFVNPEAGALMGREPAELVKQRLLQEMPENRDFGLFDRYVKVIETGNPDVFDIEYSNERFSKWFHVQAVNMSEGLVVTFLDISKLKHYQGELMRKENLLQEAQDLANLGSWTWNLGDSSVEWSSNVNKIFGLDDQNYSPSYIDFVERILPEDKAEVEATIKQAIEKKEPYDLNFRIQPNETVKYLEVRAIPKFGVNNTLVEYLGIIKDITGDRAREEILRKSRNRAMQVEKVASSERMAKSIAHEIRNPLTNITLATEQLKAEVPESGTIFLDMISRNSKRIEDLIRKLMDSARQAALNKSSQNINELLDGAIALAMDRIKLRNINIIRDYQTGMCPIDIDGDKVRVALLNIIINAVEAVDEGGGVRIETRMTEEECITSISDNGSGIVQNELNQLFDPFFTGKKKGLGLGLTSTLNILNSHDANIEVESEPGQGTTFTITFKRF